jgi:hypothetical protein
MKWKARHNSCLISSKKTWSKKCFSSDTRIKEKGRAISLKLDQKRHDCVVLLPEKCHEWPENQKRCDGVFICGDRQKKTLLIVFAELKGGHLEKAVDQIGESCGVLCRSSSSKLNIHRNLEKSGFNHKEGLIGIIVAKSGISLAQDKRNRLFRQYGIKIRFVKEKFQGIIIEDLTSQLSRL